MRLCRIERADAGGWVIRLPGVYVERLHEPDRGGWMLRLPGTFRVPGVLLVWEATGNGEAYGSIQLGGEGASLDLTVFFADPRRRLRVPLVHVDVEGASARILTVQLGREPTSPCTGMPNPWLSVTRWRPARSPASALSDGD